MAWFALRRDGSAPLLGFPPEGAAAVPQFPSLGRRSCALWGCEGRRAQGTLAKGTRSCSGGRTGGHLFPWVMSQQLTSRGATSRCQSLLAPSPPLPLLLPFPSPVQTSSHEKHGPGGAETPLTLSA